MFERRLIRRERDGGFSMKVPGGERAVIREVLTQLRSALDGDPTADPGFRRLFPVAYADDPEREREYRSMVGEELTAKRRAQIDTVLSTIDSTTLTEDELFAWMGAINDLRLVLGTRLDVSEETDLAVGPDDPDAPAYALYGYLGWLLEQCVAAVAG
jgi:hypothetical protein